MKKLNRTQKASRASGFAAMTPRGQKRKAAPYSAWRGVYPTEKPEPIIQHHRARGIVVAESFVPVGAPDPITGKYPTDEHGRTLMRPATVCRHRCTHINMRHHGRSSIVAG